MQPAREPILTTSPLPVRPPPMGSSASTNRPSYAYDLAPSDPEDGSCAKYCSPPAAGGSNDVDEKSVVGFFDSLAFEARMICNIPRAIYVVACPLYADPVIESVAPPTCAHWGVFVGGIVYDLRKGNNDKVIRHRSLHSVESDWSTMYHIGETILTDDEHTEAGMYHYALIVYHHCFELIKHHSQRTLSFRKCRQSITLLRTVAIRS